MRIRQGWTLDELPALKKYVLAVIARLPRAALAAQDARDARDALDALAAVIKRFAAWCIQSYGWYWRFELSWLVTTHIGCLQLEDKYVDKWAAPLFQAFISGCWIIHFIEDTLYWVAKPKVHVETIPAGRRLHNATGPALESDVENLYFLHGVMVPAFVVTRPEWITLKHIDTETNAEIRRVMIERYGQARYLMDSGAKEIHRDDFGVLYRKPIPNDEDMVMVKVVNATAEADGSFKDYFLRVPPDMQRAHQAVAWTFGKTEETYAPEIET